MLWQTGTPLAPGDVFVRHVHLEELAVEIACAGTAVPNVYIVSTHVEPHLEIAAIALRSSQLEALCLDRPFNQRRAEQELERLSQENQRVVLAAMNLVAALHVLDAERCLSSAHYLRELIAGSNLPPPAAASIPKLLAFLTELVERGLRPLDWPALDLVSAPSERDKKWWRKRLTLRESFERLAQRFDAIVNGAHPAEVRAVRGWVEQVRDALRNLESSAHPSHAEAESFRAASAFFAASCERRMTTQQPVLALIELHRTWEWLLCAQCALQGKLDYSTTPVQIYYSGKWVAFDALMEEVQRIQPTFLYGISGQLTRLNEIRNVLAYTHQIAAPMESELLRLYTDLSAALPQRTNARWRSLNAAFRTPFPVGIALLVDPDGTLRSGLRKASPAELDPATYGH